MPRTRSPFSLYLDQIKRARLKGDCTGAFGLVRDFPAWRRSQGRSGLTDEYPWITFEVTRRLAKVLAPTSRVFEYGSGGSTLFLARRAAEVVSVENDPEWYEVVRARLMGHRSVELVHIPGEPPTAPRSAEFGSRSALFSHLTFERYVRTIERFPDAYFDILIVDGRARPSAFFHGERKVHLGGAIILDDSNRSGYASAVAAATAAGWPAFGRIGPKPYTPGFAKTTLWIKTTAFGGRADVAGGGSPDGATAW